MPAKQVIVVRKDLNMTRGKEVAQGAHACLAAILAKGQLTGHTLTVELDASMTEWLMGRFVKICLSCSGEDELRALYAAAQQAQITCSLIQDSGLTMFAGVPTYTACAIGPGPADVIDKITGHLKLR